MDPAKPSTSKETQTRKVKWKNVTDEFTDAVKDLKLGQLLHDDLFGLFEAMSAIEMMDPKMDAGMVCNRGVRKIKSFEQAVKNGTLKIDNFEDSELIGIIDQTLACLVSWLEGHSLAQTVFINLYLHKPFLIEDRTLKAFSLSIYKLLDIIKDYVHKAMVYEEEDFQLMPYGYHLNPDISEQRMLGMLREVEEELNRRVRSNPDVEETKGLFARIKFIRVLLQALIMFRKEDQQSIVETERLLVTALEMLFIVNKTVDLGKQVEEHDEYKLGFEPTINQRLLPPTFPRYTKIKSRSEAINYFTEMTKRIKTVCKIQGVTSLHQALDFFIDFSKAGPCILSRSALQLLYPGPNITNMRDILREAVKSFICPPALVAKTLLINAQATHCVESFLTHCALPFSNFLQLCGHNRARQRDKLVLLLEEFNSLQDEAERVDAFLHSISLNTPMASPHVACFGTWILYHTLQIMIMYLLSGFELELYSVHEYYYIYWYLFEFLYGWLVSALTRADSFLVENEIIVEIQKNKGAIKKKPKYKKKNRPHNKYITYLQALQNMSGGYYKALMAFNMEGKLQMPNPKFDNEQVRYEHRFAPFQNLLTPPPVVYSEFKEMTTLAKFRQQIPVNSGYFYTSSYKHFHQARKLLESLPHKDNEVNDLIKIAKTNFVVLRLISEGHQKDPTKSPSFDFSVNKYFAIIKPN